VQDFDGRRKVQEMAFLTTRLYVQPSRLLHLSTPGDLERSENHADNFTSRICTCTLESRKSMHSTGTSRSFERYFKRDCGRPVTCAALRFQVTGEKGENIATNFVLDVGACVPPHQDQEKESMAQTRHPALIVHTTRSQPPSHLLSLDRR
jgi:hypothetical protein